MKQKISSFEYRHSTNLGDEIQTIAAVLALKKLGYELGEIVDRKTINNKQNINLLVNGYFDIEELANLVKNRVNPIFSNIHINGNHKKIDPKLFLEYKKYQPIGCRDRWTKKIFDKYGVSSFFNYCMTLTLDKRDENIKGDTVFIVDLDKLVPLSEDIKKAKIVRLTHNSVNIYSHKAKMVLAEELLERYKNEAKLVITSRLHCALPCIAMGIPVIVFADKNDKRMQLVNEFIPIHPYTNNRGGLRRIRYSLMRIRHYFYYKRKVDWNPKPQNIEKIKQSILENLQLQITKNLKSIKPI